MEHKKPLVSVCMISYKHAAFIADAIEGVLMQQADFPIQLVIGEDSSPDDTRAICEEYAAKYPHIIKLLPSDDRYGMINNFFRTLNACEGKYIAMCDGDDYWTDPKKLQVQAGYMEAHPGASVCSHALQVIDGQQRKLHISGPGTDQPFIFRDCVITRPGGTASMMFRNDCLDREKLMDVLKMKAHQVDWALELLLLDKGSGYYISSAMGVYRKHGGGITSTAEHSVPVNSVRNRLFVIKGLRRHISSGNRKYLNSFIGILAWKLARIDRNGRWQHLYAGATCLLRYPYYLVNLSKVSKRYNPFL